LPRRLGVPADKTQQDETHMRHLYAIAIPFLLAACSGGTTVGGTPAGVTSPTPVAAPARGSLIGNAVSVPVALPGGVSAATVQPVAMTAFLETAQSGTTAISGPPQCAVSVYRVHYNTIGGAGESTDASAAIMVPSGPGTSCANSRPVLLYAHGTSLQKSYDMADIANNTEARLAAAVYAAQGFIVVAPNYTGYGGSSLSYHPYLDQNAQSADMIDALRAARSAFAAIGAHDSGKLMVTGYSQGGYVALATQRAMQLQAGGEFAVTAAAGMSGPYAISQFGDQLFGGAPRDGATVVVPMIINAGQHAGAGLYKATGDIYENQYAGGIADLIPGTLGSSDLVNFGKLPATALFATDSMPQTAGYAQYFGAGNLVRSVYRSAYLADMAAHPCSQDPLSPLACAPAQALRAWLLRNDLRNYAPGVPLLLCGGDGDPTVPYFNTTSAAAYFHGRGANVIELNIDSSLDGINDFFRLPKLGFATAKAALRAASGGDAVASSYHAGLLAPFCMAASRDWFQSVLVR
jgi:pimeloyl-ACP methyl ester carboxylesterase